MSGLPVPLPQRAFHLWPQSKATATPGRRPQSPCICRHQPGQHHLALHVGRPTFQTPARTRFDSPSGGSGRGVVSRP
ncbi:MAG: hypothetical protein C0614_07560, partial [Desulfuromonas sp.]